MLKRDGVFYPLCAVLILIAVVVRYLGLPMRNPDMDTGGYLAWYGYVLAHGRFAALKDNFYNYPPVYIYLLDLISYLDGLVPRIVLIKSLSFAFELIAAFIVFRIVARQTGDTRRSTFAALLFLCLPTLIMNGAFWGQCDIIYTTFLLAFAWALIAGRPVLAMAMFSVALSIKVQAIFAAPFVVYLLLKRIAPLWTVILPALIYSLLVLPAALAGRTWLSLYMIYADQAAIAHKLSARAPNVYLFVQHFLPESLFPAATVAGILLAGTVSLWVLWTHFRQHVPPAAIWIVAALTLWLALEPSLLPKMHERYFFGADIFAFLFAVLVPRTWWIAALFQLGSAFAYLYFMTIEYDLGVDLHPAAFIGALAAIAATIAIWRQYGRLLPSRASTVPQPIADRPLRSPAPCRAADRMG
jgi:Gpi18-like mannosyltransferase